MIDRLGSMRIKGQLMLLGLGKCRACKKAKRVRDLAYHKEKMMLCKKEEAGIQLSAEQADWRDDINDDPKDQELKAHYMYMAKIKRSFQMLLPLEKVHNTNDNYNVFANERQHHEQPESINDKYVMEKDDRNTTLDLPNTCSDEGETDKDDDLEKECDLLAFLTKQLKFAYFFNVARECKKAKRVRDLVYHKEKMLLCKQEEAGIQLSIEQDDWRDDTNDEPAIQESKAHYMYIAKIKRQHLEQPESINDKYVMEKDDRNTTFDSPNMCSDEGETDKDDDLAKEHDLLASLIEQLNFEIDDNKKWNKILESSNKAFQEVNKELGEVNTSLTKDFKKYQIKLDRKYYYADHMNDILGVYNNLDEYSEMACDYLEVVETCERHENELSKRNDNVENQLFNEFSKRTRKPIAVPISTREPKQIVNQSVAKPHRKTVASESTIKKPRSTFRRLYEHVSKTCSWWYTKLTPPGYKWEPKTKTRNVKPNVSLPLGNESRTSNMSETKSVRGSNLSNTPLSSYSFVARRNYPVGCGLEMISNDLLTCSHGTDLYSITLQETTSPNLIFLMAKASSSQAWLWHRRRSHLNFDTINLLSKNDIVNGLPKLKFVKDHLCSSCELGKAKRSSFKTKTTPSLKGQLHLLYMDLCGPMRIKSFNGKKYLLVIVDDVTPTPRGIGLRSRN
ncbi:retrovirus-related pol polyprotein from transposon TNT 1-94 [Tanacetum coccineum]